MKYNDTLIKLFNQINQINETLTRNSLKKRISYSLAHDVSIGDMKSQGYQIFYDFPYNHSTSLSELNAIKAKCLSDSVLCAGGAAKGSDNLLVVSCGNCHSVLSPTLTNQPVLINGAYWYLTEKKSFGFSPISSINQRSVDCYDCDSAKCNDCNDNKRLSWSLISGWGGWRLGKLSKLNYDNNYRKILLIF